MKDISQGLTSHDKLWNAIYALRDKEIRQRAKIKLLEDKLHRTELKLEDVETRGLATSSEVSSLRDLVFELHEDSPVLSL